MAFANFSLTTAYTAIITAINTQLTAVASLFKDQTTGDFAGQVRLSTTNKRLEYWTGSAWAALDLSATAIANATNATTAATAANATTHIADVAGAVHGAVSTNTANMLVRRDASGNFSAGTITASLTGNASGSSSSCTGNSATATKLITPRAINGVNFDGTSAITITAAANDVYSWAKTATKPTYTYAEVSAPSTTGTGASGTWGINVSGSSEGCTGNSATATKLITPRAINGVNFDGSANITINAVDSTAREVEITAGTALQYWRGDKTWQTMPTSLPANGGTSAACSGNSATATSAITQPITDRSTNIATTEFVGSVAGSYSKTIEIALGGNTMYLSLGDVGSYIRHIGTGGTYVLPSASTCPIGSNFTIHIVSGYCNVLTPTNILLNSEGALYVFTSNGSVWYVHPSLRTWAAATGTGMLLPNNIRFQWGYAVPTTTSLDIVFPVSFAYGCYNVQLTDFILNDTSGASECALVSTQPTVTGFRASTISNRGFYWFAVGS